MERPAANTDYDDVADCCTVRTADSHPDRPDMRPRQQRLLQQQQQMMLLRWCHWLQHLIERQIRRTVRRRKMWMW